MTDLEFLQPEGWAKPSGYSNGIAARGRMVFVAGQIGWDPATSRIVSDDLVEQTRQAFANIVAVLKAGGAEPAHVVRMTWYLTDRARYLAARPALGEVYRSFFGRHFPVATLLVVSSLAEERALVEIEVTAVVPG